MTWSPRTRPWPLSLRPPKSRAEPACGAVVARAVAISTPVPTHASHRPCLVLNENQRGASSGTPVPQRGQVHEEDAARKGIEQLGGIDFEDYAFSYRLGSIGLMLILFDGGLNTPMAAVRACGGALGRAVYARLGLDRESEPDARPSVRRRISITSRPAAAANCGERGSGMFFGR